MSISSLALRLFETGTADAELWDGENRVSKELEAILRRAHSLARAESAFEAPELDLDAAAWSLNVLAWGCRVFADRTEVNTELPKALVDLEPKGDSPSEHWSADLGFRFYFSLIVRCQQIGPYDSLVQQLVAVGNRWPLATVGVPTEINPSKLAVLLKDKCLRSLLIDRIVERNDEHLAKYALLAPHVAFAVGAEPNLRSWSANRK